MKDALLGRKTRWNWGKNSKRELRYIEKQQFQKEVFEELAQDEDDRIQEIKNREYKEYLRNHWINFIQRTKGLGVAQPGSVPDLDSGSRRFESSHSDVSNHPQ